MINPANIPLSLYIHIPWCIKKCPYCDFNSHQSRTDELPEADYLSALIDDIEQELKAYSDRGESSTLAHRPIETIFIGGGTPSLMSPDFYRQLFDELNTRLPINPNAEITLEANPGSLQEANDTDKLKSFRQVGINRLSIGVQSFDDANLQSLGRVHNAASAKKAFYAAREAEFDNINIDLMFGLADQTIEQAIKDLQTAIDFSPEHISWYQLTIEPNTVFYSKRPTLPDDDYLFDMGEQGQQLLDSAGYHRYEISAYAKTGSKSGEKKDEKANRRSKHNLNYWRFGDYIGIGAGAHGKLSAVDGIVRRSKTRVPDDYINNALKLAAQEVIEQADMPFEFMLNALRLIDGFDTQTFEQRTGLPVAIIAEKLDELEDKQLLTISTEVNHSAARVVPAARGMQLHNTLVSSFIPDGESLIYKR